MNRENNWVDCIGPFFKNEWNVGSAMAMFSFSKAALSNTVRFNFFFCVKNQNCHMLMEALSARWLDNEYILELDRADYRPQRIKHRVVQYTDNYETELIQLHSRVFPGTYVAGEGIVNMVDKMREVFCVMDSEGVFAGYGVLKYSDNSKRLTAEIFAVKKEKRGKGYGRALLNTVIDSAFNKHGGSVVDLVVEKLNTRARALYGSCGFKLVVENESFCIITKHSLCLFRRLPKSGGCLLSA